MQALFVKYQRRPGALAFAVGSAVPGAIVTALENREKIYDYRPVAD